MFRSRLFRVVVASSLLLVVTGLAGIPTAQASPRKAATKAYGATSAAVAGRHLQVKISGLAAGHAANVVVTGPKSFRKKLTRSATLTKLRPGTYQVRVGSATAPHGARIYPLTKLYTPQVTAKKGASVAVKYTTTVSKTTKVVAGKSISRIKKLSGSKKQLTFSKTTSLKKGDILASGTSTATPNGLLVKVVSVSKNRKTVVTEPATLLEAVPTGQLIATGTLSQANETPQARRAGLIPSAGGDGPVKKDVDEPLAKCSGDAKAEAKGSISISPSFKLSATWSFLHGITGASLTANITEDAELEATLSASGSCSGQVDLFKKPVTFATFLVWVGDVPIVLQPQLQITLEGKADAKASVTTSASQILGITSGLQWTKKGGVSPVFNVTNKHSYQAPTLTASGTVEVSLNPEINLLIDGVGGPEVGLTGGLELSADVTANPWWKLEGSLAGNVGLAIPDLKIDKRATLAKKTWDIAHAAGGIGGGGGGVPTIEVSSNEVWPWSSSSGCSTAGSFFEVVGSGFEPNSSVDLTTDWTSYGSIGTDSSGAFDVEEEVGALAGVNDKVEGVHVDGAGGKSASGFVLINNDWCGRLSDINGQVTLTYGVNGHDSDSEVSLYVDDEDILDTTADDDGSGSWSATFACPADGELIYDITGSAGGVGVHIDGGPLSETCDPGEAGPNVSGKQESGFGTSALSTRR